MDYNTSISNNPSIMTDHDDLIHKIDDDEHPPPRSSRSKSGITPLAVILARNVQSFFANKIEKKDKNDASSSGNNSNAMDVCAVLHDVDEILDHRTIEDGRLLLRGMVADLLREIDILRYKYDTLHSQYVTVKEERDVVNHEYNDRINALIMAVQNAITPTTTAGTTMTSNTGSSDTENEWKEHMQEGKTLSADDAAMLTIQSLTKKIESLHIQTMQQQDMIVQLQERMEDVQCDNDAKVHKIMALEKQFTQINKKRTKMITKFPLPSTTTTQPSNSNTSFTSTTSLLSNTSLLLRPLRVKTTNTTTTTANDTVVTSNEATNVIVEGSGDDDDNENVDGNKVDDDMENYYNAIYQDNKENIIANIIMNNNNSSSKEFEPTVPSDKPNDDDVVVDNDTDMIPKKDDIEVSDVVSDMKNEEKNVDSPLDAISDKEEAATTELPLVSSLSAAPPSPLDTPDDEGKENIEISNYNINTSVAPSSTPVTKLGQDIFHENSVVTTTAVVTPPQSSSSSSSTTTHFPKNYKSNHNSSNSSKPKTVMILNDRTNQNTSTSSNNRNIHSKSGLTITTSTTTSKKHQPRAPRLVKLVEQV